jgi:ribosomal-protein-serine acetyltransferase
MQKIEIRKYKNNDITSFYNAVLESKTELMKWLPWCDAKYSIEDSRKWIIEIVPKIWNSKTGCEFIIVNSSKNTVVGGCCLERINYEKREASIGYWIRTNETRKGIATRACFFLLKYGFEFLMLKRIKVISSKQNKASVRVAEKLPYSEKYLVTNGFQIRNKASDALVFLITKESYEKSDVFKNSINY